MRILVLVPALLALAGCAGDMTAPIRTLPDAPTTTLIEPTLSSADSVCWLPIPWNFDQPKGAADWVWTAEAKILIDEENQLDQGDRTFGW